ncbi:MAG: hypothetical protein IT434_18730 [Phycisphaerales bacterium]|nr:hypothetical protein [Phycisphaerales bacterium]
MAAVLVYHKHATTGTISPFDEAALLVSRASSLQIVSPYIGVTYIERLIAVSRNWYLLSDVEEWLRSLSVRARPRAWLFIRKNLDRIHHCPALHAKVLIGDSSALIGSANFTIQGILGRTEMGVLLNDIAQVEELRSWFHKIWQETTSPTVDEGNAFVQWLDDEALLNVSRRPKFVFSSTQVKVRARLVQTASLELPLSRSKTKDPLDLTTVAKTAVIEEAQQYESIQQAVRETLRDLLASSQSFSFREFLERLKVEYPGTTLRDAYFGIAQFCTNHIRSVFGEQTGRVLILGDDGRFHSANSGDVKESVRKFDAFLVILIQKLDPIKPSRLPSEDELARLAGLQIPQIQILIGELVDIGFLILDDISGEVARYQLDPRFTWDGQFLMFSRAKTAWEEKRIGEIRSTTNKGIELVSKGDRSRISKPEKQEPRIISREQRRLQQQQELSDNALATIIRFLTNKPGLMRSELIDSLNKAEFDRKKAKRAIELVQRGIEIGMIVQSPSETKDYILELNPGFNFAVRMTFAQQAHAAWDDFMDSRMKGNA